MAQVIATWKVRNAPAKTIDRSRYTAEQLKALDEQIRTRFEPVVVLKSLVFKKPWAEFEAFPCFSFYLEAFRNYRAGRGFPHDGGLDSQPSRTMIIMSLMGALLDEEEAQAQKKQRGLRG